MPRTPSGDYNLPPGQPVVTDTIIESSVHNTFAEDVADALSDSLSRSGKGGMFVPFRVVDGSPQNPGLAFVNDYRCGLSRDFISGDLQLSAHGQRSFIVRNTGTETVGIHITNTLSAVAEADAIPGEPNVAITAGIHTTKNLKISPGAIQAADNGSTAELHLNKHGGMVFVNNEPLIGNAFSKSEHIDETTGTPDAGKPIILNPYGKVDLTMCDCHSLIFIAGWTPSAGAEYPDTTGYDYGAFWIVENITNTYTFTGGDLAGRVAENGSVMIFGQGAWGMSTSTLSLDAWYRVDGSLPILAPFAGGGQQLKNIADGTDDHDAVTKQQLGDLNFLPIDGKAVDSELLDGHDSPYFSPATHNHDSTYAPIVHNHDGDYSAIDHDHDADYFLKTEFIASGTGIPDAGKPIILDSTGQISSSFLDVSVFYYVGTFTPVNGDEYPDTTGETHGAFWAVQGLTADYTFVGGNLAGLTISNGDFMVWAAAGWSIMAGEMNPTLYYMLDGSNPLTGNFQAGGFQLQAVADGVLSTDAATVGQMNAGFLPIDGKAADTDLFDGKDSLEYVLVDNSYVVDCDEARTCGFYATNDSTLNVPGGYSWGMLVIFGRKDVLTSQIFTSSNGEATFIRSFSNGAWAGWSAFIDNVGDQQINGQLTLSKNSESKLTIEIPNAPVDEKTWSFIAGVDGAFNLMAFSDDGATSANAMRIEKTGTDIDRITLYSDQILMSSDNVVVTNSTSHGVLRIQSFNDSKMLFEDPAGVNRGAIGIWSEGANNLTLRAYNTVGTETGSLAFTGETGEAEFTKAVSGAMSPTAPEHLTRRDYVDGHYLRDHGNFLPFDGTDRVFTESEIGVWEMTNFNTDWTSVGYPIVSGSNAWTRIVLTSGGYGQQEIWGYSLDERYSRRLSDGAWLPWVKNGGGAKIAAFCNFFDSGQIHDSYNISGIVDNATGDWTATYATEIAGAALTATPLSTRENFGNSRSNLTTSCVINCWKAGDNSHLEDPDIAMCFSAVTP